MSTITKTVEQPQPKVWTLTEKGFDESQEDSLDYEIIRGTSNNTTKTYTPIGKFRIKPMTLSAGNVLIFKHSSDSSENIEKRCATLYGSDLVSKIKHELQNRPSDVFDGVSLTIMPNPKYEDDTQLPRFNIHTEILTRPKHLCTKIGEFILLSITLGIVQPRPDTGCQKVTIEIDQTDKKTN